MTVKASEEVAVVGAIDPDANTAAAYVSDYGSAVEFQSFMAIIQAGTLGSSATLDAKLTQATTSAGAGAKDVSGKSITQLTQAGTDSDKQAVITCKDSDLDVANGFDWVAITMTVATATSDCGAVLLGLHPRHGTASDNDVSSVDEIV